MLERIKLFRIEYDTVCIISKRLNKLVVEVIVNDQNTYAYINNTGKLKHLIEKGRKGYCTRRTGKGSTKYRLFAIEYNKLASLIDTRIQENTFAYMVNNSLLPWLNLCLVFKESHKNGKLGPQGIRVPRSYKIGTTSRNLRITYDQLDNNYM